MGHPATLLLGSSIVVFLLVPAIYGSPIHLYGKDNGEESGVNGYLTSVGEGRNEVTCWRRMAAAQTVATIPQSAIGTHQPTTGELLLLRQAEGDDAESWAHDKAEGGVMDWYWYRRRSFDSPITEKTPAYLSNKRGNNHIGK
ncbi:Hypp7996 [Branchiostoma lanceolatum]|uniref:Hypp7996 protein n=1 Tax=Branchiostoma lanceolatum TaxID=7740 RepID=A0A8J9Z5K1_BRALA|nr:Hypp7996 [Branchiostoma lanceolatum]